MTRDTATLENNSIGQDTLFGGSWDKTWGEGYEGGREWQAEVSNRDLLCG